MKRFKKQFLAATLVLALGAAVYLNWSLTTKPSVTRALGESKLVNATVSTETQPAKSTQPVSQMNEKQKKFFADALNRRKVIQDKIVDTAAEVLDSDNISDDKKTEAQAQVAGVIKCFTMQDSIETSLKAKGFSECICFLNENGCTVTVLKSELTKDRQIAVKATVKSVANVDFERITVVTV